MKNQNYSAPEPAPVANNNPSIHDLVIEDMKQRKQFGLEKYGTLLQAGNGRKSVVDLFQELLDATVYCRLLIEEQEQAKKERDSLIEALVGMVEQYLRCDDGTYTHVHMTGGETALEVLEDLKIMESEGVYYRFVESY